MHAPTAFPAFSRPRRTLRRAARRALPGEVGVVPSGSGRTIGEDAQAREGRGAMVLDLVVAAALFAMASVMAVSAVRGGAHVSRKSVWWAASAAAFAGAMAAASALVAWHAPVCGEAYYRFPSATRDRRTPTPARPSRRGGRSGRSRGGPPGAATGS